ncbi:ferric-chelate reductase [Neohortaea acidophila]|uniref:ferric-chelate reductase (NADPH) n=1 Tax=Neohortaea acidophila TaxID=245834 RepID=A0A6A6PVT0_9PEZI|nr:ferric-chelate reductase [Neohortaea acidophila]KAF2484250.1 ferric-chelate reductase [Neohortaea acidophila]
MMSSKWLLLAAILPATLAWTPTPEEIAADNENSRLVNDTALTWACIIAVLLAYTWTLKLLHHVRRIVNFGHGDADTANQLYFATTNETWARFKRHWLIAPLFRTRHMRESKLSAAMNMGTLPSRIQTFWLLCYFALNTATAVVKIHWHMGRVVWLNDLCNRTGTLATLNLIPLFLLAGRNNPLIWLLDISFDNYNLLHRWIGRMVVVQAFLHGAFWIAEQAVESGWSSVAPELAVPGSMQLTGTIGIGAFIVILFQSPSVVRHAFYETFLHVHILLVLFSVVVIWLHLEGCTQQTLLIAAVVCWVVERLIRVYLLIRNNLHRGVTKAEVEVLPGDAVRITLRLARPWKFNPGQHVYLYLPSVGIWTSHPFTIAWSQELDHWRGGEKALPLARQDMLTTKSTSMSLVVRRRTGFTDRLYTKAARDIGNRFTATALVEGPYGGKTFRSYGTVMLFAAGVGITHQVPQVRDLLLASANGTCATRKIVLVWIVQSPEHLEWVRPWMTEILGMHKRREVLRIMLFVTRPRSTKEIHSPSASVQMFPGKPNVAALVEQEQTSQVGAMAVSCCGTGSLSDDLRKAVRERCEFTEIDFSEESFSW